MGKTIKHLFSETVEVPIHWIKTDPNNPNKMTDTQLKSLKYSMEKFDDVMPIVVDSKTMIIADGHHRYRVYKETGVEKIPVIKKDFKDDSERVLFSQTMNKLRGEHDKTLDIDVVYSLIRGSEEDLLEFMRLTAVDDERAVYEYLKKQHPEYYPESAKAEDEENLSKLLERKRLDNINEQDVVTKTGDIWKLGDDHYILCGDCTDPETIFLFFSSLQVKTIDMLLTDPPYGVDYSTKNTFLNAIDKGNRNEREIQSDSLQIDNYRDFFSSFLSLIPFADYNTMYIFMSGFALHTLREALDDCNLTCSDYLVWVKNNHVLGRKDYNAKHEFILYGWKNHHRFYGDFNTTILQYDKPNVSKLHPTMKPLELLDKLIYDGSQKGMIVYDPFLGSGSTLISCERTKRKCIGLEIERVYCDVTLERFIQYTGKEAIRLSDNKSYSELKRAHQRSKNADKEEREELI